MLISINGHTTRWSAPDGVPPVGTKIDNGGQYYYTVRNVRWVFRGFFRRRLEALVELIEHERLEDGYIAGPDDYQWVARNHGL